MGTHPHAGALIHSAGKTKLNDTERRARIDQLAALGFTLTEIAPECAEDYDLTAGKPLERALLLAQALTQRKYAYVWAARGGFGTTELPKYLESVLPPVLPPKLFIGFSDNSFLGNYLAARHPNLTYIHANHAFDPSLLDEDNPDSRILFDLINGQVPAPQDITGLVVNGSSLAVNNLQGPCIPFNLSLAESFSALKHVALPDGMILFLEDINEELFRIVRKFDSLCHSGLIDQCSAIVVGNFTNCPKADGTYASEIEIAHLFSRKANKPIIVAPVFGHAKARLPLVAYSDTSIIFQQAPETPIQLIDSFKAQDQSNERAGSNSFTTAKIRVCFEKRDREGLATKFRADLFMPQPNSSTRSTRPKIHFTGVGGTGMAAVAGLFASDDFHITGSDNPIYPPMDAVIRHIGLEQTIGYHSTTLSKVRPDAVVLANVITRRNAELKPNLEMEALLDSDTLTMSFPSALRKYFLHDSINIVVSGTHGKTSTTSLIAQMLQSLNKNPSLFVGGAPANFQYGYKLGNRKLFVLEGDEYDSALFDKGPKFLHYEPKVALINNIEFDHADIYPNVEAIEEEFYRLACLTRDRNGIVVANADDPRVVKVVQRSAAPVIWFGHSAPHWAYGRSTTLVDGMKIYCKAPGGIELDFKIQLFGEHNAMNATAAMATLHALDMLSQRENNSSHEQQINMTQSMIDSNRPEESVIKTWQNAAGTFSGVKRRFELIGRVRDIVIFDDFAHHPTAIATTLNAFRSYVLSCNRKGRLIACFDPRNATMRRSVLQEQLTKSFAAADLVMLGKVPVDLRLKEGEALDGEQVAQKIGPNALYFNDNEKLLKQLIEISKAGDTIVFMSSGAFDGLPRQLLKLLEQSE